MKSIRAKITAAIVICSLISATLISLISISDSRDMSNTHAEKELTLSCQRTGEEINALISRVEQSVDTLSAIALQQTVGVLYFIEITTFKFRKIHLL